MCSIPTTCRPCLCTICTALAPEAVGTFRMNEATSEATNHPISHPEQPTTTTSTQVIALPPAHQPESGTSQADQPHRPLTQLVRILPRCWHDPTLPWNQTLHETRGDSALRRPRSGRAHRARLPGRR